ncbi:MAG: TDP-N-acetylfucosamine:lipid II N-acetylfucosaminyltransferase [Erysipelotrichaceae bacterium]
MELATKILHFFPNEKFTRDYILFVNRNFDVNMHYFLIYGSFHDQYEMVNADNVTYEFRSNKTKVFKIIDEFDNFILHSMFLSNKYLLKIKKNSKANVIPVFWGGDLYDRIKYIKKGENKFNLKLILSEHIRKLFYEKIKYVGTLTPQDYDFYLNSYKSKAKNLLVSYTAEYFNTDIIKELIAKSDIRKERKSNELKVLVGHCASREINHINSINLIKRQTINCKVFVPLSYGDKAYSNEVIRYGKQVLSNKFVPIQGFMSFEEYSDFLSDVDLFILDSDRQIGLGNIFHSLLFGTQLFLPENSKNFQFLKDYLGLKIFKISDFTRNTIENYENEQKTYRDYNRSKLLKYLSETQSIDAWNKLFEKFSSGDVNE